MESPNQQLEDLKEIRRMMERSTRFLSLSGLSGITAGIVALAGSAVAYMLVQEKNRFAESQSLLHNPLSQHADKLSWLVLDGAIMLLLSLSLSFYFTRREAKKKELPIWDETTWRMLKAFSIPLAAGGLFCILLIHYQLVALLAPSTLLFYGISLVAAGNFTRPELQYLGFCELVLGFLAGIFPGYGLIFWTLGFGLLHIAYGYRMYVKYER